MNYYIVTGASKGLGEAIVHEVLKEGNIVIGISRSVNDELVMEASRKQIPMHYVRGDLSNESHLESIVEQTFQYIDLKNAKSITFIQNAGVVEPIKPVGEMHQEEIVQSVHVNLLAPMILSNLFINRTYSFTGKKTVVHITSGAANRTVHGWSAYCTTKAGLDMFTKTFAFEQQSETNPIEVIGYSPGIMDTDMQQTIRTSHEEHFRDVHTFRDYFESGMLRSPQFVAEKLIELLETDIESGVIYSVKDLIK